MDYLVLTSEAISIYLIARLWGRSDAIRFKIFVSVFTLIPLLGPLFFYFLTDYPSSLPVDKQNRFSRGNFTQNWDVEKRKMKEKIRKLEQESNEDDNKI